MSILSSAHMLFGGATTLLDGLVGFWKMNGDATDVLGVSNGTVDGSPWTTGKLGQGLSLTGSSRMNVGTAAEIHPLLGITVAGWFYFTAAPADGSRIMSDWHQDGGHDRWIFYCVGGALVWYARSFTTNANASFGTLAGTIPLNAWVHLAGTFDGSAIRAYRDGALVSSTGLAGTTLHTGSMAVCFGRQIEVGAGMVGMLDEVGMWDRALSDGEVSELYNSGAGKSHPFS